MKLKEISKEELLNIIGDFIKVDSKYALLDEKGGRVFIADNPNLNGNYYYLINTDDKNIFELKGAISTFYEKENILEILDNLEALGIKGLILIKVFDRAEKLIDVGFKFIKSENVKELIPVWSDGEEFELGHTKKVKYDYYGYEIK